MGTEEVFFRWCRSVGGKVYPRKIYKVDGVVVGGNRDEFVPPEHLLTDKQASMTLDELATLFPLEAK